ncbi:MAG: heat-inducible transcription repressor HrcA [Candidatus Cloacimonetes bacterium]|nr:heat-inducible transcription repressor HrcA [Candidatus Cloacimonadota bacterium]MBS3767077.1 heat-inducible transcription repressor HrcA [Candidatus Cloacimonadota bacterium]
MKSKESKINMDSKYNEQLTPRQKDILKSIILEHIKSAKAVGSNILTENYDFSVSSATIRNEMMQLAEKGLIEQPHTSAGRIPTEKGYQFYINDILDFNKSIPEKTIKLMHNLLTQNYKSLELMLSAVQKFLAHVSGQMSIIAEPDFSCGNINNFNIFQIDNNKLLVVLSLSGGFDKTFVIPNESSLSSAQIKALVRYLNDRLSDKTINEVKNFLSTELENEDNPKNEIILEIYSKINEILNKISDLTLSFDGEVGFISQPEFDSQEKILNLLKVINNQEYFTNTFRKYGDNDYTILMGEEFEREEFDDLVLIFGKYTAMDLNGYLGILGTKRMNYRENIPLICFAAKMITELTRSGTVIPYRFVN